MVLDDEINEIGEELNIDEVESNQVNNVIPKPENLVNFLKVLPIL